MTSPSEAFNKAIAGVNDFMTSKKKKAALTYNPDRIKGKPILVTDKDTYQYSPSKMPKGTMFGAFPTSQSKALQAKK